MRYEVEQLKNLQHIELELIEEVDRICRKNDIRYTLYAGTLLGAVRHEGFVPWDDDADIAFPPGEYEKFSEACKRDLDDKKFFLQDHGTDEFYRWGYAKLRRNNSAFIREGQEHMQFHQGICIDLFPLYYVPDGFVSRKLYYAAFFLIRKILYSPVGKMNDPNLLYRIVYSLVSKIPKNAVFWVAERLVRKAPAENVDLMYIPNSSRCRYGFPAKYLKDTVELQFEGRRFFAMADTDTILSLAYGDYMTYPPVSERVSHNPASEIRFPSNDES